MQLLHGRTACMVLDTAVTAEVAFATLPKPPPWKLHSTCFSLSLFGHGRTRHAMTSLDVSHSSGGIPDRCRSCTNPLRSRSQSGLQQLNRRNVRKHFFRKKHFFDTTANTSPRDYLRDVRCCWTSFQLSRPASGVTPVCTHLQEFRDVDRYA